MGRKQNKDHQHAMRRRRHRLWSDFAPLWEEGHMDRPAAYAWLSTKLGLRRKGLAINKLDGPLLIAAAILCRDKIADLRAGKASAENVA